MMIWGCVGPVVPVERQADSFSDLYYVSCGLEDIDAKVLNFDVVLSSSK